MSITIPFRRSAPSFLTVILLLWAAPFTHAAEAPASLIQPQQVMLTPQSARLQGEVRLTAVERDGQAVLLLTLPQHAEEISLQLLPPHANALRAWRVEPVALAAEDSANAKTRTALLEDMDSVQSRIDLLRAQQSVLRELASNHQNATPAQAQQLLQDLERQMLPLSADMNQQERQLASLQKHLARLPEPSATAQQTVIVLNGVKPGATVAVRYACTLPKCGWSPVYIFDAQPAKNSVHMRMLAEVWQDSGMDWNKADITLTTSAEARRDPQPLNPWIIRRDRVSPRPMQAMMRMAEPLAQGEALKDAANAAPEAFESEAQSGWTVPKGMQLPEGRTRLPILEQTWQAPLQRLARPSMSDTLVWLTAKYTLPEGSLPSGEAVFLLDGTATGSGRFAPRDGVATLYFGADPLVTVRTQPDTRLTGKAGIIDKRQTWQWGWTYTVRNDRTQPVDVRLEEPAPQAGDKDIDITFTDKPEASRDKDHVLFWDVKVPAKGTAQVRHEVRVSAPQDMEVWTGR